MSAEIEIVRCDPEKTDMRGIRFTQSATGHVHSPWFTYDYSEDMVDGKMVYGLGYGRYAQVMGWSTQSFASVIGVDPRDVIATEHRDNSTGEIRWRLGTRRPWKLPTPPAPKIPVSAKRIDDAIEVEVSPVTKKLP